MVLQLTRSLELRAHIARLTRYLKATRGFWASPFLLMMDACLAAKWGKKGLTAVNSAVFVIKASHQSFLVSTRTTIAIRQRTVADLVREIDHLRD